MSAEKMISFKHDWDQHYPGLYPVGFMLRSAGARHWLRFHSLAGSKRYADTDDERRALLSRQEQLAGEILGDGNPCWLVQTCWKPPEGVLDITPADNPFRARGDYAMSFSFRFCENDAPEGTWDVYAAATQWEEGKFSELLLAIADEKAAPTLWFSPSGEVFAPYDGGIDLFLPTLSTVESLRKAHRDWLSKHPQWL